MFIELETGTDTIQIINTNNITRIQCIGNKRPTIHFIDGSSLNIGMNRNQLFKLLTNK